jgi:hypothetical protein
MDVSIMTVLDQMDLASMELSGNSQIATTGIGE